MIAQTERMRCTGCTACMAVCLKNCISMEPDTEGFLYPTTNHGSCVACGKYETVCSVLHHNKAKSTTPAAYAVRTKNMQLRLKSSSGGVFPLLADMVLANGGAVFGASFERDCKTVCHRMITERNELEYLRSSKYLQSKLENIFQNVRAELNAGRQILFTGTPCQIDGLKSYLQKDYENLLCAEVICHGVPSPKLWQKYISTLEKSLNATVNKLTFRDKKSGWSQYSLHFWFSNGKEIYSPQWNDPYMQMFLKNVCLRPSCYQCPSKGLERCADLTLGDFWGIQNVAPELDDDKGTSLVLVHTEKGRRALQAILDETEYREVDCMTALEGNSAMLCPVSRPAARDTFFADMESMSFAELRKKYVPQTGKDRIKYLLQKTGLLPLAYRAVHIIRG